MDKCQSKAKTGKLIKSARTDMKVSANLSQETLMRQLAVITSALEDLIRISENLHHGEMGTLESWTNELVVEMANQKDATELQPNTAARVCQLEM